MDESQRIARLCTQTGISEAAARAALRQTGGDLLEAALLLEKTGQLPPTAGGSYSTASGKASAETNGARQTAGTRAENAAPAGEKTPGSAWKKLKDVNWKEYFTTLFRVLIRGNWEVWWHEKRTVAIPLLLMVILLCVRFPLVPVVLAVCLLLGCRYRIAGPDFPGKDGVNRFLDGAYALIRDLMSDAKGNGKEQKKRGKH